MQATGYVVRETEAAIAFVAASDAGKIGVKPLWIPRKKIISQRESDSWSRNIVTAQDGKRLGKPIDLYIDAEFAARVGVA